MEDSIENAFNANVTDIFYNEILISEQVTEQKNAILVKTTSEIKTFKQEIEEAAKKIHCLEGHINTNLEEIREKEISLRLAENRKSILEEIKTSQELQLEKAIEDKNNIQEEIQEKRHSFSSEVLLFCKRFTTGESLNNAVESDISVETEQCEAENIQMDKDIAQLREQLNSKEKQFTTNKKMIEELEGLNRDKQNLEKQFESALKSLQEAIIKNQQVQELPQTDPEFIRMRERLNYQRNLSSNPISEKQVRFVQQKVGFRQQKVPGKSTSIVNANNNNRKQAIKSHQLKLADFWKRKT